MSEFVEKRRYFRVEDRLEMAFKTLTDDSPEEPLVGKVTEFSRNFAELENQIQHLCQALAKKHPPVGELGFLLNKKMNLIKQCTPAEAGSGSLPMAEQAVSLSACGIAFYAEDSVDIGSRLLLRLKLQPAGNEISVMAYVIASELREDVDDGYPHLLRADFTRIDEEVQELLIQHVMSVQAGHLRRRLKSNR